MRAAIKRRQLAESVSLLLQSAFTLVKQTGKLFALESKLARKSLAIMFTIGFVLFGLTLGAWIMCLSLIVLLLHALMHSWILALVSTIVLNIVFIIIGVKAVLGYGKNLRFAHTRRHLFTWGANRHALKTAAERNPVVK